MHVEKGGYPTRLPGCFHNPPIQTKRKSSSLYLSFINCWEDTGKIILNRLNAHLDKAGLIPESQCGFRKDRGTIYIIFTARKLQEKCQEETVDLYMTFFDQSI